MGRLFRKRAASSGRSSTATAALSPSGSKSDLRSKALIEEDRALLTPVAAAVAPVAAALKRDSGRQSGSEADDGGAGEAGPLAAGGAKGVFPAVVPPLDAWPTCEVGRVRRKNVKEGGEKGEREEEEARFVCADEFPSLVFLFFSYFFPSPPQWAAFECVQHVWGLCAHSAENERVCAI